MKAITLHQPWASLIAEGIKTIETRSWAPPRQLIGQRIAIHAGKHQARLPEAPEAWTPLIEASVKEQWRDTEGDIELTNIPTGAVVATAILYGNAAEIIDFDGSEHYIVRNHLGKRSMVLPDPYGDFSVGRWLWLLDGIQEARPADSRARLPEDMGVER